MKIDVMPNGVPLVQISSAEELRSYMAATGEPCYFCGAPARYGAVKVLSDTDCRKLGVPKTRGLALYMCERCLLYVSCATVQDAFNLLKYKHVAPLPLYG